MSLFFTIGAARCGKSTYAGEWARGQIMPELEGLRVVWNQDKLRLVLTGQRYNKYIEPFVHVLKPYIVSTLILLGYHVLVDGTHTTGDSIKELLRIDPDAVAILFDVPEEVCRQRAIDTGQADLIPVIRRHCENIAKIKSEGLHEFLARNLKELAEYENYRWSKV